MKFVALKYTKPMEFEAEYRSRINRVASYVDEHLAEDLTLNDLAEVSGISVFHLHRLFQLYTGEPLAGYVRRQRISRGMRELARGSARSVLEIALDLGYENTSAFIRAFKKRFGITPKSGKGASGSTLELWRSQRSDSKHPQLTPVRVEQRASFRLLGTAVKGYEARSFERAAQKCFKAVISDLERSEVLAQVGKPHAIFFDDPDLSFSESMVYFGGFEWFRSENPMQSSLELFEVPSSLWAVFLHQGSYRTLWQTWNAAYRNWLALSSYDLGESYPFELYVNDPRTVRRDSELVTEIYIPLKERL
jgi:AraC family transcriptional regulator